MHSIELRNLLAITSNIIRDFLSIFMYVHNSKSHINIGLDLSSNDKPKFVLPVLAIVDLSISFITLG